jgi:hypothetical protein
VLDQDESMGKESRSMSEEKKRAGWADIKPARYNPRKISPEALAGLRESLRIFGDLSGLVWNQRTGNIVCGHQRRAALEELCGGSLADVPITWGEPHTVELGERGERFTATEQEGTCEVAGVSFRVRLVDWPVHFEKAANIAANSTTIQGEFTDDLAALLAEVQKGAPAVVDDLMLMALLDEPKTKEPKERNATISEGYQVVIDCTDETMQREVFERLSAEGLPCRVLTL